jgi:hypothetical protein
LVWNPNIEKDKSKLNFVHNQTCAPTQFKLLSKKIQTILELAFFKYFKLFYVDSDVDFYKLSESYSDLNEIEYNENKLEAPSITTTNETEDVVELEGAISPLAKLMHSKRKRNMSA